MVNLRQIEAFREVMRQKTVTRAAEALHISQPAVSRLINDLEYYVGFKLFARSKRQLLPTPEAYGLLEEVDRSYFGLERIVEAARDIREFKSGHLLVCAMPSLSLSILPCIIKAFTQKHPRIAISLQTHSSQRVLEWVSSQQCDLGFIGMEIDDPSVTRVPFSEGAFQLVMLPDHHLTKQQVISPQDLVDQPIVGLGQQLDIQPQFEQAFKAAGVEMNIQVRTQLSSVACELVLAGCGVSLVDPLTASAYKARGLAVRHFEPVIKQNWNALLPSYRPASRLAREFIDMTREQLNLQFGNADESKADP